MARLSGLPQRVQPPTSRNVLDPVQGQATSFKREEAPWRRWYKTARWLKLRKVVLVRDAYTCRACGRVCSEPYPADGSPVVDHIQPHRGREHLFWLEGNLQVLCKAPCHDKHKQRLEQATKHHIGVWD